MGWLFNRIIGINPGWIWTHINSIASGIGFPVDFDRGDTVKKEKFYWRKSCKIYKLWKVLYVQNDYQQAQLTKQTLLNLNCMNIILIFNVCRKITFKEKKSGENNTQQNKHYTCETCYIEAELQTQTVTCIGLY